MVDQVFEGQHDGEKIMFVFRRHIISMRKGFYALLVGALLGSLIGFGLAVIGQSPDSVIFGLLLGLILGGVYLFFKWIEWYFSVFIVTNERIRQSVQKGLFGKSVIDLNLDNVQNVSYNMPGFTGELFGFGTIVLQTMVGDMVINRAEHVEKNYNRLSDVIRSAKTGAAYHNKDKFGKIDREKDEETDV